MRAIAQKAGHQADAYHLNLRLAAMLSPDIYEALCWHRGFMTGEWLFSVAAFGAQAPAKDYFAAFPSEASRLSSFGKNREYLLQLRHRILPEFIKTYQETPAFTRGRNGPESIPRKHSGQAGCSISLPSAGVFPPFVKFRFCLTNERLSGIIMVDKYDLKAEH